MYSMILPHAFVMLERSEMVREATISRSRSIPIRYYPVQRRGMGVGAMVAVGRTGAIAGPVIAGQLLALGAGTAAVLTSGVPAVALAALALVVALRRAPAQAR